MKGVFGFIGIASVIYVFWITFEYFLNKSRSGDNAEKSSKTKEDEIK